MQGIINGGSNCYEQKTFVEVLAVEAFVGFERGCICARMGKRRGKSAFRSIRSTLSLLERAHSWGSCSLNQIGLSNLRSLHGSSSTNDVAKRSYRFCRELHRNRFKIVLWYTACNESWLDTRGNSSGCCFLGNMGVQPFCAAYKSLRGSVVGYRCTT